MPPRRGRHLPPPREGAPRCRWCLATAAVAIAGERDGQGSAVLAGLRAACLCLCVCSFCLDGTRPRAGEGSGRARAEEVSAGRGVEVGVVPRAEPCRGELFLQVFTAIFGVFFSLALEAVRVGTGGACAPTSGSRQWSDRPTNGMRV
jgi:hypothetical protein